MRIARSTDATEIAYETLRHAPTIVLVAPALSDRSDAEGLAGLLAAEFTTVKYDRRGRGRSGDAKPYAVDREVEDIEALIDANGGSASLFGVSSGAVLALEAAAALGDKVTSLALYEPPFIVDDSRPPVPADYGARVADLAANGGRGDAVELFMTEAVGIPAEFVIGMRQDPSWANLEEHAHTLAYDAEIMGDTQSGKPLASERWASVSTPTLVITGENSEPFMAKAAEALVERLQDGRHEVLPDQDHSAVVAAPETLAPVLISFLS